MAKEEKSPTPKPAKSGASLSLQQKGALIGGALILVLVLATLLQPSAAESNDPTSFSNYLYSNQKSGLLVDLRGASSGDVTQKIKECGQNLVSGTFFSNHSKDLLIYYCNQTSCLWGHFVYGENYSYDVPANASDRSIQYSDALYNMRERAYFHVSTKTDERDYAFHPTYMDIFIGPNSSTGICKVEARIG